MSLLKLAILSDMHIGDKARSLDLLPPGSTKKSRDERFLEAFETFASKNDISADCLVIAGDFSCKADVSEFTHASAIAKRVAVALGVVEENIYFTPGNHDVDWSVLKLAEGQSQQNKELRWRQRYSPIVDTDNLFANRTSDSAINQFSGSLFSAPFVGAWRNSPHTFVAVNSSAHDCPAEPNHYGLIRDEALEWIYQNIPMRPQGDESIRCMILHHHLTPHGNLGQESRDFSVCQNGDRLLTALRDLDFDLVIHGHKHLPRFEIQLINSDHPVAIVGAGSFSADLGEEYGGGVQNQFHLLSIEGRYQATSRIFGTLKNWAYVFPRGWQKNIRDYTVVDHQIGFGGPLDWKELARMLQPHIHNSARAGTMFSLESIGPVYEHLAYVSPDTARKAIDEIAKLEKLDIAWNSGATLSAYFR